MDILKFLKSFNTVGTYLTVMLVVLISMLLYFYIIAPQT
ncbi:MULTISPECIES: hypothetical protein [Acinetobacter]|nr:MULTISPECIES: hypothetical protein [Acinetobacter]MCG8284772.1 hypothetical protein [Acinetobacter seifertii]MCH2001241.1 hypothetical protein [Acinetobacter seifertii]MDK4791174.1 hypothetical protein [Acinetobacter sp.]MDQ9035934.1 hypothetical protein [Acinetobacter seifertii]MEB3795079.1 hypothetical protein [Acinetobacter sp. IK24]